MIQSTPASDDSPLRTAAPDAAAILLVHQGGRITHANQAAHALWQAEPGGLGGELFSNLLAAKDPHTGEAQPDLWLLVLGTSLNADIPLRIQRSPASSPAGDNFQEVVVRVEKLADEEL